MIHLEGRVFGPGQFVISPDRVADFVEVTGDDGDRWLEVAPPGFASAALFVVAPDLLSELSEHSVLHGEQTFTWHGPLTIGSVLSVSGVVTRLRERGGVNYVGFDFEAKGDLGTVLEGSSLFLVTGDALPVDSGYERPEPPHSYRGEPAFDEVSASRADLVRYAASTRDWNPIHWDHDAAVAAGLPGVVAHGLLQASWAFVAATRHREGRFPLLKAKVRFRNPLLPARPARVTTGVEGSEISVSISDPDQEYLSARVELSSE